MNSLLKMLPIMLRLSGENEEVREIAVFVAWRAAAGSQISYNCIPFQLYEKRLTISTLDLTWKTQMEQLSGQFLFKINSLLGGQYVTFIDFLIDRETVLGARPEESKNPERRHTEEIEAELALAAGRIKNQSLRELFIRAASKSLESKEMESVE